MRRSTSDVKRTSGVATRVAAPLVALGCAVIGAVGASCASTAPRSDRGAATSPANMPNETVHESEMAPWRSSWNFADPVASESAFRAALASTSGAAALELETQIARALGLQKRFDEAAALLDDVEGRAAKERGASRTPMDALRLTRVDVFVELERGRLLRSRGTPEASSPRFLAAFERASATGLDYLAVDAAHMLGIVAPAAEASAWNTRALALAESSADPLARGWAAAIANNQGWTEFDAGRHAEALALFERALAMRRERPEQREPLWIARWCVARAWRALGRVEEALLEQRALLAERTAAAAPDGYVHEELGECLLALGRAGEAREHFAAASHLLAQDTWLAANEPARLARLARLAAGGG
jgi:tetratricopeptide (TPR) repeat protein